MGRKRLTDGETKILVLIQEEYGPQNSERDVVYANNGDAMIFAKDPNGVPYKLIDLTDVAAKCENGTIKSEQELISKYIRIPND